MPQGSMTTSEREPPVVKGSSRTHFSRPLTTANGRQLSVGKDCNRTRLCENVLEQV